MDSGAQRRILVAIYSALEQNGHFLPQGHLASEFEQFFFDNSRQIDGTII